jgi:hypothetical protein
MGIAESVQSRFRSRRYTPTTVRIGMGCAVIAAVCLAQFSSSTSGADDTAFVPGTATASAQAIQVAPTTGGLSYAVILATSVAAYQNAEGQALAQTIDLGAIGTALEANNCATGGAGTLNPNQVPAPAQAESTNGNQTINLTIAPKGSGSGAGVETATATDAPAGNSTTTLAGENLAGLVDFSGATTSAQASTPGGDTRSASATADITSVSLLGGKVVLDGLHWAASQTSGASNTSTASFTLSGITVAGIKIPLNLSTSGVTSLLSVLNTALSPVGLQIDWPQESTLTDGTVQISPLIIGIDNNVLGQEVVGANLSKVETVRNALQQDLLNVNCNFATELTVSDIGVGPLAGGGNANVELGGAQAITTDAAFTSPFGTGSALGTSTDTLGDSGSSTLPDFSGSTLPTISGTTGTLPTTTTAPSGGGTTESLGKVTKSTSCDSIGPAGGGCTSSNLALPVGLIGLGLLAALAAWDYTRQRRRSRLSGLEA